MQVLWFSYKLVVRYVRIRNDLLLASLIASRVDTEIQSHPNSSKPTPNRGPVVDSLMIIDHNHLILANEQFDPRSTVSTVIQVTVPS